MTECIALTDTDKRQNIEQRVALRECDSYCKIHFSKSNNTQQR